MGLVGHAYSLLYKWWVMFLTSSPHWGAPGSWGTSTRATHTVDSLAGVNACMCMNVHECAFVAVFVYKLPCGHLSFPLSCYIFHLRHTRFPQSLQRGSLSPLCELHSLSTSIHKPTLSRLCSSRFCKVFTVTSVILVALQ